LFRSATQAEKVKAKGNLNYFLDKAF